MQDFYNTSGMSDLYQKENSDLSDGFKDSAKRKLKTLRALLIMWVLSFAIVLFWFTLTRL